MNVPEVQFPPVSSRTERTTTWLGLALAVTFTVCFITGLISHFIQHPASWAHGWWPSRPAWLYRVSQGLHVTTGLVSIPLLGLKLWSVAPKFWKKVTPGDVRDIAERISVLVLIAGAGFQLLTGLFNVAEAYRWKFFFPSAHYAVSWVTIGALIIHIAVKLPIVKRALNSPPPPEEDASVPPPGSGGPAEEASPGKTRASAGLGRRGVLALAGGAVGMTILATTGDKVALLSGVSALSQRSGNGSQGLPVNQTANGVRVIDQITDPDWALVLDRSALDGAGHARLALSLDALMALPQHRARLPIACVEGWSVTADWEGVSLRTLLELLDPALLEGSGHRLRMNSLAKSLYGVSEVSARLAGDPDAMIALRLNGEVLNQDHGFPARLIAPNRPGAMQTKWLGTIEVLA